MIPGEYHVASEPIDYNGGYEAISLEVKNVGDRAAEVVQPFVLSQVKRKQYNLLTLEGNVVFLVSITRSMVS